MICMCICTDCDIHYHTIGAGVSYNYVQFLGEAGEDGGGLKRKFWTLLCKSVKNTLFEGGDTRCILRHDAVDLQVRIGLICPTCM